MASRAPEDKIEDFGFLAFLAISAGSIGGFVLGMLPGWILANWVIAPHMGEDIGIFVWVIVALFVAIKVGLFIRGKFVKTEQANCEYNLTEYATAKANWDKAFYCHRCGSVFIP